MTLHGPQMTQMTQKGSRPQMTLPGPQMTQKGTESQMAQMTQMTPSKPGWC